jgi:hypothetical protein
MIHNLVKDAVHQFLNEIKKDETFEKIQQYVLDPVTKYVKKTTYPYIHLCIFILLLYTITLPIIIVILVRQNRLLTHCISLIKKTAEECAA